MAEPKAKKPAEPKASTDYSMLGDIVNIVAHVESKHLTKGMAYEVGKETAIILLEKGLVKLG